MIADRNEELANRVGDLFETCATLRRGDIIEHTTIQEVLGVKRGSSFWAQAIVKLKKRMLEERHLTLWCERGVGYKLLTAEEQVTFAPQKRVTYANRHLTKARKTVKAVAESKEPVSLFVRRATVFQSEQIARAQKQLRGDLQRQALFAKREALPRQRPRQAQG